MCAEGYRRLAQWDLYSDHPWPIGRAAATQSYPIIFDRKNKVIGRHAVCGRTRGNLWRLLAIRPKTKQGQHRRDFHSSRRLGGLRWKLSIPWAQAENATKSANMTGKEGFFLGNFIFPNFPLPAIRWMAWRPGDFVHPVKGSPHPFAVNLRVPPQPLLNSTKFTATTYSKTCI